MSILAKSLKRLYGEGKISKVVVDRVFAEKGITETEYQAIIIK